VWIRSLSRALVTADASTQSAAVHGTGLPLARSGLRGTVAARSWLYQRREPSSLITWGVVVVVMGASSASTITTQNYQTGLFIAAVVGSALTGIYRTNVIGQTGPGFGLEAMALSDRSTWRAYFSGLNLAAAAVALPLLIAVSFVLAVVARHPADGITGVLVILAGVGAGMAIGNILSARLAYPMERRPGNPTPRAASGYAGRTIAATFGSLIGVGVLVAPVIVAWELTRSAPDGARLPILVLCAAGYGLLLAWAGVRIAARVAEQNLPELYQIAVRSKL
jgi:ABC-2 type transport system permease protein